MILSLYFYIQLNTKLLCICINKVVPVYFLKFYLIECFIGAINLNCCRREEGKGMVDQREMVHDGENNCEIPENVKMMENGSKLDDELTTKAALMQVCRKGQLLLMCY